MVDTSVGAALIIASSILAYYHFIQIRNHTSLVPTTLHGLQEEQNSEYFLRKTRESGTGNSQNLETWALFPSP